MGPSRCRRSASRLRLGRSPSKAGPATSPNVWKTRNQPIQDGGRAGGRVFGWVGCRAPTFQAARLLATPYHPPPRCEIQTERGSDGRLVRAPGFGRVLRRRAGRSVCAPPVQSRGGVIRPQQVTGMLYVTARRFPYSNAAACDPLLLALEISVSDFLS